MKHRWNERPKSQRAEANRRKRERYAANKQRECSRSKKYYREHRLEVSEKDSRQLAMAKIRKENMESWTQAGLSIVSENELDRPFFRIKGIRGHRSESFDDPLPTW